MRPDNISKLRKKKIKRFFSFKCHKLYFSKCEVVDAALYEELQQNKIVVLYVIQTIHLKCPSLGNTIAAKQTYIKKRIQKLFSLGKDFKTVKHIFVFLYY